MDNKLLSLQEVKDFLKVDYEDEDSTIQNIIDASEYYLYKKTGKHFINNAGAKLYCKILINEWFKDRGLMQDRAITAKVRYSLQSLLVELQYCPEEEL